MTQTYYNMTHQISVKTLFNFVNHKMKNIFKELAYTNNPSQNFSGPIYEMK